MATVTLDDLLRYKKKVTLKHPITGKAVKSVWVRLLGDEDLKEAFKFARIASSRKRASLRDENSDTYKDEIAELKNLPREDLEALILASRENVFANESQIIVPREDLPEIEEIAVQPDAPTLEEQEKLDTEIGILDTKFKKAVEEYIQTKVNEVKAELAESSFDEVVALTIPEYINIESLQEFLNELNHQKGYRSTYIDEACESRGFSTIEAYKNANSSIKQQIILAYDSLELNNDDIKN